MSETELMQRLRMAASTFGSRLFRQQTGMGWTGKKVEKIAGPRVVHVQTGDVVIRGGRPFHSGFAGWSDLGGWVPVEVTPDMIGAKIAIYAQVEVKEGARPTTEQIAWIEAVRAAGGRAGVARSEDDLRSILFGSTN